MSMSDQDSASSGEDEKKEKEKKPPVVWFESRPPYTPREMGPPDVPLHATRQEVVWALVLKALHATCGDFSTGVKNALKKAHGVDGYRWIKVVREPLARRLKDVCYPEDEWHLSMAFEILDNELVAFASNLPESVDGEPSDRTGKLELVGREVEKVRLVRERTLDRKAVTASEAKEAILTLRMLLKRMGTMPEEDLLASTLEVS